MCGVTGFIDWNNSDSRDISASVLTKMNNALMHRGPDSSGIWFDASQKVFLGHTRLSILDLSEHGHQPMTSNSGRFCISFNGEIYNHQNIRKKIEKNNPSHQWKSESDTETILESFNLFGVDQTLEIIEGMFSIALFDIENQILYLIRDKFGEKPLYVSNDINQSHFFFSSDLDSLRIHHRFKIDLDHISLQGYLKNGFVPKERSIYSSIRKVEAGTYSKVDLISRTVTTSKYWNSFEEALKSRQEPFEGSYEDASCALIGLLKKKISNQMISDVPIGSFLSGGIDSSLITSIMQEMSSRPVKTFTIGFEEEGWDEALYAKRIANTLGTDHHESYLTFDQAIKNIPNLSLAYSEPFADSSQIPTLLLAREAKKVVTVALTGDAGDELFCGYDRYKMSSKIWHLLSSLPIGFRIKVRNFLHNKNIKDISLFLNLLDRYAPFYSSPKYLADKILKSIFLLDKGSFEEVYDSLISIWHVPQEPLLNNFTSIFNSPFLSKNGSISNIENSMLNDTENYLSEDILVKVDRASMWNSLETRIPFLDHETFKFAWSLPQKMKLKRGESKSILKKSLESFVPRELFHRPKKGFSIPLDSWLRGPLRDWSEDLISKESIESSEIFSYEVVNKIWMDHLEGNRNWQARLWTVLMFQSWYKQRNRKLK